MAGAPPTVVLPPFLERALATGHPWIYRDHVPARFAARTGDWVRIQAGKRCAYGLWDAASPIAIRVFSAAGVPDAAWLEGRVRSAWELRAPLRAGGITAFRWVNGEGDGLPGIVVDLYADHAVIVTYSDAVAPLLPGVVTALERCTRLAGVSERPRSTEERAEGLRPLRGAKPPADLTVTEHGLKFHVDLARGQKTGLFLDHRENRRHVGELAPGRSVLNLFAYTGSFSLYAARAGAREVVSVDLAAPAIAAARANFELNALPAERHEAVAEDAYAYLERALSAGRRFDLIISDPPSFARNRGQQHGALRAYTRLHTAALRLLTPGGLYAAASCTAQVSPDDFRGTLAEGAGRARTRLQIVHEAGQALDHPVAVQHPEGRYLKFVVGRSGPVP